MMAAANDLELLRDIVTYEEENLSISKTAFKAFANHLWYLSENLVRLAFSDERISLNEIQEMQEALKNQPTNYGHKATISREDVLSHKISDFVTSKSLDIYEQYGGKTDWLTRSPSYWKEDEDYKATKHVFLISHRCQ